MTTYKKSGVDIDKGSELVSRIKSSVKSTYTSGVINPWGSFASLFKVDFGAYKKPILVSSTDGVGTKLKLAFMAGRHDTIGIDLVAMSVNDILVYGAKPLFFLDYIAVSKLDVEVAGSIIEGIVEGCKESGCALVGGETAEMPSFYQNKEYDCAGFVVGVVDEEEIIDGSKLKEGDLAIGISSSGIHSNGYSLVRDIFFNKHSFSLDHIFPELGVTLSEALLKPTKIYVKPVLDLIDKGFSIKAMCHITGGGIVENLPRVLTKGFRAVINLDKIKIPPIFKIIAKYGEVAMDEMLRVFNMGVGYVLIVSPDEKDRILSALSTHSLEATVVGHVEASEDNNVIFPGLDKFRL